MIDYATIVSNPPLPPQLRIDQVNPMDVDEPPKSKSKSPTQPTASSSSSGLRGLRNLRNICYLSASIQC